MKCPNCYVENDFKVTNSRPADNGKVIKRRRECKWCGYRFTTREVFIPEEEEDRH